jgi:hypothetical protein
MLNRFVVPASRLTELERARVALDAPGTAESWPVSVLLGADPANEIDVVAELSARHEGDAATLRIEALETKAAVSEMQRQLSAVAPRSTAPAAHDWTDEIWFEVSPGAGLGSALAEITAVRGGAKLRTGGLEPGSIPSPADVARVVLGCVRAAIPFKATAGLHHPFRGERARAQGADGPRAIHHGFVNVWLAAALAQRVVRDGHPDPEAEAAVVALLEEHDVNAFKWGNDEVIWRESRFDVNDIEECRTVFARSFGSCSFNEPIDELSALRLI